MSFSTWKVTLSLYPGLLTIVAITRTVRIFIPKYIIIYH